MYDITQLNEMLVPELIDIADQLKIPNSKKLDKQELIYKILDKQAVIESAAKPSINGDEKISRKRIIKTTTANVTEEAEEVHSTSNTEDSTQGIVAEKPHAKRGRKPKEHKEEARINTDSNGNIAATPISQKPTLPKGQPERSIIPTSMLIQRGLLPPFAMVRLETPLKKGGFDWRSMVISWKRLP